MIIYVSIPHTNDDDSDYYQFGSLLSAIDWLRKTNKEDFIIRTSPEIPADDYTYME